MAAVHSQKLQQMAVLSVARKSTSQLHPQQLFIIARALREAGYHCPWPVIAHMLQLLSLACEVAGLAWSLYDITLRIIELLKEIWIESRLDWDLLTKTIAELVSLLPPSQQVCDRAIPCIDTLKE